MAGLGIKHQANAWARALSLQFPWKKSALKRYRNEAGRKDSLFP